MKLNLNEKVKFKLREPGKRIYGAFYRDLGIKTPELKVDFRGYSELHFWELMAIFGSGMNLGSDPPIETEVIIGEL